MFTQTAILLSLIGRISQNCLIKLARSAVKSDYREYYITLCFILKKGVMVMAQSKCAECGNTSFEIEYKSPSGSRYKIAFVQCSKCGAVVGITDRNDTAALLEPIRKKLGI